MFYLSLFSRGYFDAIKLPHKCSRKSTRSQQWGSTTVSHS